MQPVLNHQWNISKKRAIELQQQLASKVVSSDILGDVKYVAGVDVAYEKYGGKLVAAVVVLDATTMGIVDSATHIGTVAFPYIPGLFSFRELPPIVEAFKQLSVNPDIVVCDGQGIAHPRRFGLACHLGLTFDVPTIGCSKTKLIGIASDLEKTRGSISPLKDNEEIIGSVLRTQNNVNPVYVSIGHKISLKTACNWILTLSPNYRLPETTRLSDQLVNKNLRKVS